MTRTRMIKNLRSVHNNLPIGIIATALGAMTLSNVYVLVGLPFVKDCIAVLSIIVLFFGLLKVVLYPKTIKAEFNLPIIACLFPTASMLLMSLGSYFLKMNYYVGKGVWLTGIILYFILMCIITYKHVIQTFNFELLTPAFLVPYVGVLTACVASSGMNAPVLSKCIFVFGVGAYIIILPIILMRVFIKPIEEKFFPTVVILVAAPSLIDVSYLTVFQQHNLYIIEGVFLLIFLFLIYVYIQIPKIVNKPFHAGFASLTFPTAISCYASYKVSDYLEEYHTYLSKLIRGLVSIELIVSTTLITFVIYCLVALLFKRLSVQDAIE